ncbi:MAG TPA: NusG domain II-containing protein [Treponemataceae bacterium]|jgi:hypothetical protein|nr:NusG domain II-containing protein [Treponemataceae bacterium]
MKIKRVDYCILILALGLCVFSFYMISSQKGQATQLVIESPEAVWKYPLEKDRIIKVQGSLGESIIEIQDKKAFFVDSACPNKTCVLSQPIEKKADWSACLPNRIFIRIDGSDESGLDAISF